MEHSMHSMLINSNEGEDTEGLTANELERKKMMEENLNPGQADSRILSFKAKAPAARDGHHNNMKVLYSSGKPAAPKAANTRTVPNTPEKILDAPDMLNDFYLHLMDWSSLNHMAVALSAGVYIWNAADGSIVQLSQREGEEDYVSSVAWVHQGNVLAVGDSTGTVQLWDVATSKLVRSMAGHTDRVGCLDWNQHILATGGREGVILLHDVRVAEHKVGRLAGHSQEVCGLGGFWLACWLITSFLPVWSKDGRTLASGGNDNCVQLWDWQVGRAV
jgi:cell division cycle protein 20 (cofactor of APC complex)